MFHALLTLSNVNDIYPIIQKCGINLFGGRWRVARVIELGILGKESLPKKLEKVMLVGI